MADQIPKIEKKTLDPIRIDEYSDRNLDTLKYEIEKSRLEAENELLTSGNRIISILTITAMFILILLTINRDIEKDQYITDIRNDITMTSPERNKLIKEVSDSFHRESTNRFYNIFVALSAYFLGTNANRNKK